jgi:hypothetical protein
MLEVAYLAHFFENRRALNKNVIDYKPSLLFTYWVHYLGGFDYDNLI